MNQSFEYIVWCDAVSDGSTSWHTKDEAIDWSKDDWTVSQIGYIIEENDEYLLIASKYNEQKEESRYSGLLKIPKTWIKKRKTITID